MKKILFKDELVDLLFSGKKTMTRRLVSDKLFSAAYESVSSLYAQNAPDALIDAKTTAYMYERGPFRLGEVVAVAQRYSDIPLEKMMNLRTNGETGRWPFESLLRQSKGWENKMFVRADLMPHRIRITDIMIERLRNISDDDCLREGVEYRGDLCGFIHPFDSEVYGSAREAFASLIDYVSGKGTWDEDPYVLAYSFKLIQ